MQNCSVMFHKLSVIGLDITQNKALTCHITTQRVSNAFFALCAISRCASKCQQSYFYIRYCKGISFHLLSEFRTTKSYQYRLLSNPFSVRVHSSIHVLLLILYILIKPWILCDIQCHSFIRILYSLIKIT